MGQNFKTKLLYSINALGVLQDKIQALNLHSIPPQSEPKFCFYFLKRRRRKTSFNSTHEMYEKNIMTTISTITHLSFHADAVSLSSISLSHTHRLVHHFACR